MRWIRIPLASVLTCALALALLVRHTEAAPDEPDDTAPLPQPAPWPTGVVAAGVGEDDGSYASMVYFSTPCWPGLCSTISVAHKRKTDGDLAYTKSTDKGATFTTTIIDPGAGGDIVGAHVSHAVGSLGYPRVISYQNETDEDLKIAHNSGVFNDSGNCGGGDWRCTRVTNGGKYSSIAIDGDNDRVSIVHVAGSSLKLARGEPPYASTDFTHTTIPTNSTVTSTAVAVDWAGQVHIAFTTSRCLYYTMWQVSFLTEVEEVDCLTDPNVVGKAGSASIAANVGLRPHVAYVMTASSGTHRVKYAHKTDITTWVKRTISSPYTTVPQTGTSIRVDYESGEAMAIGWGSVVDNVRKLMVARPGGLIIGGWTTTTGDTPGGAWSSLAVINGKLSATHYDSVGGNLRFSHAP
jgi:hypothetical protein